MTQYRVELGFDWGSSPITGAEITVAATGNTLLLYPLQLALVNVTDGGKPAYFTGLEGGDQVNFWIFDISNILGGTPSWDASGYTENPSEALTVKLAQGGSEANPFTQAVSWDMVPQGNKVSTSYAFSPDAQEYGYSPVNAVIDGRGQDWATLANPSSPQSYELSVKLILTRDGVTKTFVTDPELIVGENSTGGTG